MLISVELNPRPVFQSGVNPARLHKEVNKLAKLIIKNLISETLQDCNKKKLHPLKEKKTPYIIKVALTRALTFTFIVVRNARHLNGIYIHVFMFVFMFYFPQF